MRLGIDYNRLLERGFDCPVIFEQRQQAFDMQIEFSFFRSFALFDCKISLP